MKCTRVYIGSAPSGEVFDPGFITNWIKDVPSMDSDIVTMLCQSAISAWEAETNMRLLEGTYKQDFACFYQPIRLEAFPVTSIESIKYKDQNGSDQTLNATEFEEQLQKGHPEIYIPGTIPTLSSDHQYPVTVEFKAGHENVADIPQDIKLALAQWVVTNYENRHIQVRKLPDSWSMTVNRYRKTRF